MPKRHDTDCLLLIGELVDDAESADAQRPEPAQSPAEGVSSQRIAFEQPECVLYRVDEGPVELEQLASGAPCEDDTRHRLLRWTTGVELGAKIRECDGLVPRELRETGFDSSEGLGVGQDLGRLLQGVVLVDWNQRSSRFSVAGHQHVIAAIGDIAQEGTEIATELPDWDCLCHG